MVRLSKTIQYVLIAGLCLLLFSCSGKTVKKPFVPFPERVILNVTKTPFNSQAVTWRTLEKAISPRAEILKVADLINPDKHPSPFPAQTTTVELYNDTVVFQHSVIFNGLEPNVLYAYRVGDDNTFSEWNQFKTAFNTSEPFTFLYFGDIQEQMAIMCSQVFRAAFQTEPDARFWLFAGDMVNNGPDDPEWESFFSALGWIPKTMPQVFVPGNHEYPDPRVTPKDQIHITRLWRPQFTFPENGPKGLEETVFTFDYQGVRFVILNGNEQIMEQAAWLETVLSENPQPWTIVAIHQPVYSISERRNRTLFQDVLVPIFDRFGVDLVLQGHDHGYARSLRLKDHKPVSAGEQGTVYVISNSGPKFYPASLRYDHLMVKTISRDILFQSIRVGKDSLQFAAYNLSREVKDSFEIKK